MKYTTMSGLTLLITVFFVIEDGRTETVFHSSDPLALIRSSGLGDTIYEVKKGQIIFNCGAGMYEDTDNGRSEVKDYVGVFDAEQCSFTESLPTRIIRRIHGEQEHYKDLVAKDHVEIVSYFSRCVCNPRMVAHVEQDMDGTYRYEYRIFAGSKRGIFGLGLWTTLFHEVVEPKGVALGRYERGDTVKKKKKYYISDDSVHRMGSFTSVSPLGLEAPPLLAGQEQRVILASRYPPGVIEVDARCDTSSGKDYGALIDYGHRSKNCGPILKLFSGGWRMSLTVGPREDLAELLPDELARKLSEEVPKFLEVGWARPEVAQSIQRDLGRIERAKTATEASRMAQELLDRVTKMKEAACSVECRSIIGVNLQIMLQDLEGWKERERRRAAGAGR